MVGLGSTWWKKSEFITHKLYNFIVNIKENADSILNSNLSKKEKVIKLCEFVREIPYKRIGSLNPKDMVKAGMGSCTPKHIFLASCLKKLGVPLKFLIIPFYYKKLPLKYSKDTQELVQNMPISYHIALKAKIENKWLIIDVTWNSRLKPLGFTVNENWRGDKDMVFGVIPEEIIEKEVDPRKFEKDKAKNYTKDQILARKKFYELLDNMMDPFRD